MATIAIEHCHDKHHGRSLTMALASMGGYCLAAAADAAHVECVCGLDRAALTTHGTCHCRFFAVALRYFGRAVIKS